MPNNKPPPQLKPELSLAEIAKRMGISENSASALLQRAILNFKLGLEKRGYSSKDILSQ